MWGNTCFHLAQEKAKVAEPSPPNMRKLNEIRTCGWKRPGSYHRFLEMEGEWGGFQLVVISNLFEVTHCSFKANIFKWLLS